MKEEADKESDRLRERHLKRKTDEKRETNEGRYR